jgi:hypothetical protein
MIKLLMYITNIIDSILLVSIDVVRFVTYKMLHTSVQ